jgi:hypothetical protein
MEVTTFNSRGIALFGVTLLLRFVAVWTETFLYALCRNRRDSVCNALLLQSYFKACLNPACLHDFSYFCVRNVTYRPIVRQRLGEDIPAGANARQKRTSIARQRSGKHASSTIEAFSRVVRTEELFRRQLALQCSIGFSCGVLSSG